MAARPTYCAMFALAALIGTIDGAGAQDAPALVPDPAGVLFSIGSADRRRDEFKPYSWRGVSRYACTVGVDCTAADFPSRLSAPEAAVRFDTTSVERVEITFNLAAPSDNLVLIVARWGVERNVVRFDGGPAVVVTSEMMDPPSDEDIWGRFALPLGPAQAGLHVVELSVAETQTGTGRHSLDAISVEAGAR